MKKIVVAVLFVLAAAAQSQALVCHFKKAFAVARVGKFDEMMELYRAGRKVGAAELCACVPAAGTKIITTDVGFFSSTIRVVEGPNHGCVGDAPNDFFTCEGEKD